MGEGGKSEAREGRVSILQAQKQIRGVPRLGYQDVRGMGIFPSLGWSGGLPLPLHSLLGCLVSGLLKGSQVCCHAVGGQCA